MPDVRYVCMSDLHFGAQNSLLTNVSAGATRAEPSAPSACLAAFVDCLADLVAANEDQRQKPSLILNGDILELALATDDVAIRAFEHFVRAAFVERDLFDHTIHYVPGNHDHHTWETARERQYAAYVGANAPGAVLAPPWHSTTMFEETSRRLGGAGTTESELLNTVVRRFEQLRDVRVAIHYPNFGLRSTSGSTVLFHHGHYVESIYRLMSRLKIDLFPASTVGRYPWDWEAENFAWVDFFWSTLGRSGQWGADVGLLYDMLQDERAVQAMGRNLADAIVATGQPKFVPRIVRRWGAKKAMGLVASRVRGLERARPADGPLTAAGIAGLKQYVEGPLALQLARETAEPRSARTAFVFGHTHKPFQQNERYHGFEGNVQVYNTGGWVVDTLEPDTRAGAAAVLVDEDLDIAFLRLYIQQAAAAESPVVLTALDETSDNALLSRLRSRVDVAGDPWARLAQVVAAAVPARAEGLRVIIDNGVKAAEARPAPASS